MKKKLKIEKNELTKRQKREIEKAVKKLTKEYGDVLIRLGKE